jgi:diadenosine tetraphosphate (Ap4A) HIT family hydrolase
MEACELCRSAGGEVVWESSLCRVVRVDDGDFPGFCRVIWNAHVAEMSDLALPDRAYLMNVVFAVEAAVRWLYSPDKINLASFGNVVPHVHWHVIPRWRDDSHFPESIWGNRQRQESPARIHVDTPTLRRELASRLDPIDSARREAL